MCAWMNSWTCKLVSHKGNMLMTCPCVKKQAIYHVHLQWTCIYLPGAADDLGTMLKLEGGRWEKLLFATLLGPNKHFIGQKSLGSDGGHEDCHWREWRTTSFSGTGDETGWWWGMIFCWQVLDLYKLLGMIIQWRYIYIYMWILDRYCEWFKKHDDNFFQGSSWILGSSWLVVNGFTAWLSITFIDSKGPPIIKATLLTTGDLSENSSREESADSSEYGQVNGLCLILFSMCLLAVNDTMLGIHMLHITPPWKKAGLYKWLEVKRA